MLIKIKLIRNYNKSLIFYLTYKFGSLKLLILEKKRGLLFDNYSYKVF